MACSPGRQPVEQAFDTRNLRGQHHADQEQIDVKATRNARKGARGRARSHEDRGARDGPYPLRPRQGARDDARRRHAGDSPNQDLGRNVSEYL